jgi:hypothetical protein
MLKNISSHTFTGMGQMRKKTARFPMIGKMGRLVS